MSQTSAHLLQNRIQKKGFLASLMKSCSLYSQSRSGWVPGNTWWGPTGPSVCRSRRRRVCSMQFLHLKAASGQPHTQPQPGEDLLIWLKKPKLGGLCACWWKDDEYLLCDPCWRAKRPFKYSCYAITATKVYLYASADGRRGGAGDNHHLSAATFPGKWQTHWKEGPFWGVLSAGST